MAGVYELSDDSEVLWLRNRTVSIHQNVIRTQTQSNYEAHPPDTAANVNPSTPPPPHATSFVSSSTANMNPPSSARPSNSQNAAHRRRSSNSRYIVTGPSP
ncbi:hypothetical protein GYMLUDRAFT_49545 [Collybiopsis luxurians FD-317 M1]|uniref:Unplaced genomic scaffold GYMLUscaffold_84, whole genome shotgun sequence n=1 Tax=Collybiopsis luxurians FD-317 M1 TaxID=944289 RepID=A0A0D0BEZ8_9AGAR|nr:hypothetical protein GYMLUDRAFT_49545 [Collybiopsis luxurians FD-317 M1]